MLAAGGVAAHELLEGGLFVVREVVDVHARVLLAQSVDEVHHGFEGRLLLGLGHRPPGVIDGVPRGVQRGDAEEIFASSFGRERVTLEVEEDVAGGGLGQELEAFVFFEGPKFVERGFVAAGFELDPRLVAHFLEGFAGAVLWLEGDLGAAGEAFESGDAVCLHLAPLAARRVRHEGEMIVVAPLGVAVLVPDADVAVVDGFGVALRDDLAGGLRGGGFEPGADGCGSRRRSRRCGRSRLWGRSSGVTTWKCSGATP